MTQILIRSLVITAMFAISCCAQERETSADPLATDYAASFRRIGFSFAGLPDLVAKVQPIVGEKVADAKAHLKLADISPETPELASGFLLLDHSAQNDDGWLSLVYRGDQGFLVDVSVRRGRVSAVWARPNDASSSDEMRSSRKLFDSTMQVAAAKERLNWKTVNGIAACRSEGVYEIRPDGMIARNWLTLYFSGKESFLLYCRVEEGRAVKCWTFADSHPWVRIAGDGKHEGRSVELCRSANREWEIAEPRLAGRLPWTPQYVPDSVDFSVMQFIMRSAYAPEFLPEVRTLQTEMPVRLDMSYDRLNAACEKGLRPQNEDSKRILYHVQHRSESVRQGQGWLRLIGLGDPSRIYLCDVRFERERVSAVWVAAGSLEGANSPWFRILGTGPHTVPPIEEPQAIQ